MATRTLSPSSGSGSIKSLRLEFPEGPAPSGRASISQAIQNLMGICEQCKGQIPPFVLKPVREAADKIDAILRQGLNGSAMTQRGRIIVIHADRERTLSKRYMLESEVDGSRMTLSVTASNRLDDLLVDVSRSGNFLVSYKGLTATYPGRMKKQRMIEIQFSIVPSNEHDSDYTYYCTSSPCYMKKRDRDILNKMQFKFRRLALSPELHVKKDDYDKMRRITAKEFHSMFGVKLLKTSIAADKRYLRDLKNISNSYRRLFPYIDGHLSYSDGVKNGELRHVSERSLLGRVINKGYGNQKFLPKVAIVRINDRVGNGLAAGQYISQGMIIGEYAGEISKIKQRASRKNERNDDNTYYAPYAPDMVPGSERFVIDAKKGGNATRFINHSNDNSNAAWVSAFDGKKFRLIVVATKPIIEGKQILLKYRPSYWLNSYSSPVSL